MKFLHTSDWHIGGSKFLPDFLQRQSDMIDQVYEIAESNGVKVVVVAGDLFDAAEPDGEERDLLKTKLLQYDAAGFTTLLINGNHDQISMTGRTAIRYLSILSDHEKFHNSIVTESTKYHQVDDTVFILLCHEPKQFKRDYMKAISDLRDASVKPEYKHVILVCHETIKGAISDTNYRITTGDDVPLTDHGSEIEPLDITYIALGDIHQKQRMAPRTYYCGAPLQVKFGDKDKKGVLIVDTDDPDNPKFVPVKSKPLLKVTSLDNIPEDAYVKLVVSKLDGIGAKLPDSVIKQELDKTTIISELNMELGLHQAWLEMVSSNLDEDQIVIARVEIASIVNSIEC